MWRIMLLFVVCLSPPYVYTLYLKQYDFREKLKGKGHPITGHQGSRGGVEV
jgi:hypothetical protein